MRQRAGTHAIRPSTHFGTKLIQLSTHFNPPQLWMHVRTAPVGRRTRVRRDRRFNSAFPPWDSIARHHTTSRRQQHGTAWVLSAFFSPLHHLNCAWVHVQPDPVPDSLSRQVGLEDSPDHTALSVWLNNPAEQEGETRFSPETPPSSERQAGLDVCIPSPDSADFRHKFRLLPRAGAALLLQS